jgi:hypothetical protein
MQNFIFKPTDKNESTIQNEYYGVGEEQDYVDENGYARLKNFSQKVHAQKTITTDNTKYMVKINNNHKLYNPLGYGLEDRSYSILDNVIRPENKMKVVNQTVFDLYIRFLNTKNVSLLVQAEREML